MPITSRSTHSSSKPSPKPKEPAAAAKTPAKKLTAVAKATPGKSAVGKTEETKAIPAEQRSHYVAVAAYYIAERRGFAGSQELEDWLQAETEVEGLLKEVLLNL